VLPEQDWTQTIKEVRKVSPKNISKFSNSILAQEGIVVVEDFEWFVLWFFLHFFVVPFSCVFQGCFVLRS
jgi:hypothetical protein